MAPTTRQQQKRLDAAVRQAGSQPSTRLAISTATADRLQRKRKAPAEELEESPANKRARHDYDRPYPQLTPMSNKPPPISTPKAVSLNKPSTFLSLPRELRDEIYKHILASGEKRHTTLRHGTLVCKTGLLGANTQTRAEFLDAILFHAPVIHTTVRNHNFAPIVTFLNRLSDAQARKLATAATPNSDPAATTRSRKIIITLTYASTKQSTRPLLNRWLDRFDDPGRRGAEVRFEYRVDAESWRRGGYKQRVNERVSAGPRSREEARKMMAVTSESSRGIWG